MITCDWPVAVFVGCMVRFRPCDKDLGHGGKCAAWFQFGPEPDPAEVPAGVVTLDTVLHDVST